jgi:CheY-like chemotaxis protein
MESANQHPIPVILVVDDEPFLLAILKASLEDDGFIVHTAASGEEAIAVYERLPVCDVVLLDMIMGGLDGVATFAALRKINPAVCCCFASGNVDPGVEAELLAKGAGQVFHKPFCLSALAEALHRLVLNLPGKFATTALCETSQ